MIVVSCFETLYNIIGGYIDSIVYQFKKRNIPVEIHLHEPNCSIIQYVIEKQIKNSVIIFVRYGPSNLPSQYNNKIYYLNIEQMVELEYRKFSWIEKIKYLNIPILDYSMENINILKTMFPDKKIYFFPYTYNPNDTIYQMESSDDYDVGIVLTSSQHRMILINKLKTTGLKINIITKKYGIIRDSEISKCKIIVNIHFTKESNILESIRCYPILFKKIIVISEESIYDPNIELNNLIIYESYDNLIDKIKEVLKNPSIHKEKLDKFNFELQFQNFAKNFEDFIKNEYLPLQQK